MIVVIKNNDKPKIKLKNNSDYEFAVIQASFKIEMSVAKSLKFGIISIKSNLINSSTANVYQSIVTIPVDAKKTWYHANLSHVSYHCLDLKNLEFSSFEVVDFFSDTQIPIASFFLKLEIRELKRDFDDRLQRERQ